MFHLSGIKNFTLFPSKNDPTRPMSENMRWCETKPKEKSQPLINKSGPYIQNTTQSRITCLFSLCLKLTLFLFPPSLSLPLLPNPGGVSATNPHCLSHSPHSIFSNLYIQIYIYVQKEKIEVISQMDSDQGKLFIGGISWETSEEKLKDYFGNYGEVVLTSVMREKLTGQPRGFGFVVFADPSVLN